MKKFASSVLAFLLILASQTSVSAASFRNCGELLKSYHTGVSSSKSFKNGGIGPINAPTFNSSAYVANRNLDIDRDGIACEVLKSAPTENIEYSLKSGAVENGTCDALDGSVWGKLRSGLLGLLSCNSYDHKYVHNSIDPILDPSTFSPVLPISTPEQPVDSTLPFTYIFPSESASQPKAQLSDSSSFSDLSKCRIAEAEYSVRPHMATGFPIPAERAKLNSKLVVQFVPVEFADLKAKNTPIKDFADVKYQLEHFWQRMSSKPLNFEVRIPDKYLTMPKKIADYNLSGVFNSPSQNISATFAYSKEAAAVADPSIDFTEADVIVIAHLPEATRAQIGTFVAEAAMPNSSSVINTNERKIYNIMIQGDDQQRDIYNWTHEFGHMLGMTDFNHEGPLDNSKNVGKGFYDIMTSYRNMELLAWHRFLLGILNDDQVACVTTGASTHWLRPVEWPTKKQKAVIVPLSATSVLVVESRRRLGYDAMLGKQGEGALVYKIDTTISGSGGTNPLTIVSPPRTGSADIRTNPTLKMGESVLTDGWRISVVESGGFGDVIKVEKQ